MDDLVYYKDLWKSCGIMQQKSLKINFFKVLIIFFMFGTVNTVTILSNYNNVDAATKVTSLHHPYHQKTWVNMHQVKHKLQKYSKPAKKVYNKEIHSKKGHKIIKMIKDKSIKIKQSFLTLIHDLF